MTTYPQTITFGEMRRIRRARCVDLLPSVLLRQVGVVAVASLARQSPDSTADDDHLRSRIIDALGMKDWCPNGLGVIVRDGIVHLSGIITDERSKATTICAWSTRCPGCTSSQGRTRNWRKRVRQRCPPSQAYSPVVSFRYASGTCPNRRSTCL